MLRSVKRQKRSIAAESRSVYKCSNSYLSLKLLIKRSHNLAVRSDAYTSLLFLCTMRSANAPSCRRYSFTNRRNSFFLWNLSLLRSFSFVISLSLKSGFISNNFSMNSILLIGKNTRHNHKTKLPQVTMATKAYQNQRMKKNDSKNMLNGSTHCTVQDCTFDNCRILKSHIATRGNSTSPSWLISERRRPKKSTPRLR